MSTHVYKFEIKLTLVNDLDLQVIILFFSMLDHISVTASTKYHQT